MRVALLSHYFSTHGGGVEIVAGRVAEGLSERGMEVDWLASGTDPPPASTNSRLSYTPLGAWNVTERRWGVPWPIWSPAALATVWRSIRASDVVHIHEYEYPGITAALAMAKLAGKPVLLTKHVAFIPYSNPLLRGMLHAIHQTIGRLALRFASQVVFVSESTRWYFARYGYSRPPKVIANGVDIGLFRPAGQDERVGLRHRHGFDGPTCLFVGRFVEKKGLAIIEHLAQRLPSVEWVLVGWGPMQPEQWRLANVRVLRALPQEEIVPLYQAADLLVLPSRGEGFPLVVQEAMACGTPAIVGGETASAYPPAEALLFGEDVTGADARGRWLARTRELLEGEPPLEAMRDTVAECARTNWSWARCVESYARIFQEIGGGDSSGYAPS